MVEIDSKFLPIIEEKLEQIGEMYIVDQYEAIIDMIAPVSLSDAERLKLRHRLDRELGFSTEEFDLVFASKFNKLEIR